MGEPYRQIQKLTELDADFWSLCRENQKRQGDFCMPKNRRTRLEEAKALDRSQSVRVEMLRQHLTRGAVAYHLGCDTSTLWRRLQRGLSDQEYMDIIQAMGQAISAGKGR